MDFMVEYARPRLSRERIVDVGENLVRSTLSLIP